MKATHLCVRLQVSYFYDPECYNAHGYEYGPTAVYYGYRHPMKPHRITMTHSLLMSSGYWPSLQVRASRPCGRQRRAAAVSASCYLETLPARRALCDARRHRVQIKKARPVKEEVIKKFCTGPYYNFLSRNRNAEQWNSLEQVVREGNAESHPEASELESCGIMVRPHNASPLGMHLAARVREPVTRTLGPRGRALDT